MADPTEREQLNQLSSEPGAGWDWVPKDCYQNDKSINHVGLAASWSTQPSLLALLWGNPSVGIPASLHRYGGINKHFRSLSSHISSFYHFYPPVFSSTTFPSPISLLGCLPLTPTIGKGLSSLHFLAHLLCKVGLQSAIHIGCPACLWLFVTRPMIFHAVGGPCKHTPNSSTDSSK